MKICWHGEPQALTTEIWYDLLGETIAEAFHQGVRDYVREREFAPQDFSTRMVIIYRQSVNNSHRLGRR